MAQILRLENLKIINKLGASDISIANNLNLAIEENEWITISLPHGGGKTTLYKVILSQSKPLSGKVIYASKEKTDEYDKEKFLRENITAVPEFPTYLENFNVREWINFQIEIVHPTKYKKRLKDFYEFLDSQGISIEKNLSQLKLIEMRKLEIAFSILADTILIVCDDIDVGLSKEDAEDLENFLKEINHTKAVLMISSNPIWNRHAKKVVRL